MNLQELKDQILRFTSSPFPAYVAMTMVIETTIEGGSTMEWAMVTIGFWLIYGGSNYIHEGIEDQVEDLHDEISKIDEVHEEVEVVYERIEEIDDE